MIENDDENHPDAPGEPVFRVYEHRCECGRVFRYRAIVDRSDEIDRLKKERDERFTLEEMERAFNLVPVDDVAWEVMLEELIKERKE